MPWQHVLGDQSTIFHVLTVLGSVYASAGDANLYRSTDGDTTWQWIRELKDLLTTRKPSDRLRWKLLVKSVEM